MNKFVFPLRLKVLITVLAFLMMVVGFITATMADLFHQDKTAYVRDLSASVTSDIKTEVDTILGGYVSATRVLSEVLFAGYIDPDAKQQLVKPLFVAYPEFLALLISDEVARREQKRFATRLRRAAFRTNKTLDQFDFSFNPNIN